jgi:hypothetical protein
MLQSLSVVFNTASELDKGAPEKSFVDKSVDATNKFVLPGLENVNGIPSILPVEGSAL